MSDPTTPDPTIEPPESVPTDAVTTGRKPISARQLAANRRNGQKSTGPTTAPGKERVSRNAITHGIYADLRPIEQGMFREDPLAVQVMVDGVLDALKPRNTMERAAAMRVANVMLQIGRYHSMEAFDIEYMTGSSRELNTVPANAVFEAQFNAEFYRDVADILSRPSETYTLEESRDLLLAGAALDEDLRKLYMLLDLDDPKALEDSCDMILLTLAGALGGSLPEASRRFAEYAQAQASQLPVADAEQNIAIYGIRDAQRKGRYETHTRIGSRLSSTLDRELTRYQLLRKMTDEATHADDDDWDSYSGSR